jgi:hypothetical protein
VRSDFATIGAGISSATRVAVPHHPRELPAVLLDQVTGAGFRDWSFGAMTALSVAMGTPTGSKLAQPVPVVPITQPMTAR